jgi:hypothetical protein
VSSYCYISCPEETYSIRSYIVSSYCYENTIYSSMRTLWQHAAMQYEDTIYSSMRTLYSFECMRRHI